jgi:uncharacterized protein
MAVDTKGMTQEEEWFAREEIEKKRKLALKQADEMEKKKKDEAKALHHMKCPKCGMDLQTLTKGKVEIDTCFNCKGIWLDHGELEEILSSGGDQRGSWTKAVLGIFKK